MSTKPPVASILMGDHEDAISLMRRLAQKEPRDKDCSTCMVDNEAYRLTYFDQTCRCCVARMTWKKP